MNSLTRAERIIVACAVALIVASVLPWFGSNHVSRDGWANPLSGLGVLIATVMLLQISVVRRWNLSWPRLRITWGQAQLAMGAASFALVLIQLLIGAHMTVAGRSVSLGGRLGGVLGLFAAAGLAYGGFRASREPELNRVP